ncbi:acyl-[ACP]--phospholipid O-acyltransferase [Roseomonas arctica]|uniref:Acyl-[ACP]--phospholipid O-acyltransferase n=1 Tax=Plastoroseomonas arctica TaxID=1509237 RepID=A0AAF1JYD4_9PROT|nr:acyl-[ACP]--phospholipid O-acyltransferase [Plastoroseomonas arctica]
MLRTRRFLPLFVTQTCGALNDNLVKNAIAILALMRMAEAGPAFVAMLGGVFIAPYVLFSGLAGEIADSHDKARMIRWTKALELALMTGAAIGFASGSFTVLVVVLFGLGVQATLFSPLKYGLLPQHLREPELVAGNGLIEAGTFSGILVGTIAGGALIGLSAGPLIVAGLGIALAGLGMVLAMQIPPAPPEAVGLRVDWNIWRSTRALVVLARGNRPVWLSILGLSWFWTVGATVLAALPVIAQTTIRADSTVATLLLTIFAIGVGGGSVLCAKLLKGEVSARYVPFAAIALSIGGADLAFTCFAIEAGPPIANWTAVLAAPLGWRLLADLMLLSIAGGLYSVPLYAIIQERSGEGATSRMIAANNVVNAVVMVAAAVLCGVLVGAGISFEIIILAASALNVVAAFIIAALLPQEVLKTIFRGYFRLLHRVEVVGLENYPAEGIPAIVTPNHLSLADGALVAAFLPGYPTFAVDVGMTRKWWAKPFLAPVDVFPVEPANPYSIKSMMRAVRDDNKRLVIFPEGRLTRTGALMKVYDGTGVIADKAGAVVVPVRLEGLQYSHFSYLGGVVRRRWFPRYRLTILPPVTLEAEAGLSGRARRKALGDAMDRVMSTAAVQAADTARSLFGALLHARDIHGGKRPMIEDIERKPIGLSRVLLGATVLGRRLAREAAVGERVGIMLPNAAGSVVTFFALQAFGRVPAMLNFTAGAKAMLAACNAAEVRVVLASRRFVERGKLGAVVDAMAPHLRFIWLEDIRAELGLFAKLRGMVDARLARRLPGATSAPDSPAVVLFTSGSEGAPKGVVLSHRNLLANCAQVSAVLDISARDRVLNAMPMFHSFGLTAGTLLPVFSGVGIFFYPSPLHFRIIPEVAYDTECTIVFGTDTFLNGWARFANAYDFRWLRFAVAGAEKLRDETRRVFADRFGVRVFEGYGATETAPVLAVNTPRQPQAGTVGRLLPLIEHRLEPVAGIPTGGRLIVRGPNVMLGYLRAENPGVIEAPVDGWYDTGDIVSFDAQGFLRIEGRVKRFAKIAGEMVSMPAAEALATSVWPDASHAVAAESDPRKGERLVLVTTRSDAEPRALLAEARARGVPEFMVPREILVVGKLPLLGTGKIDYPGVAAMLAAHRVERATESGSIAHEPVQETAP